jgi:hypothetical protein
VQVPDEAGRVSAVAPPPQIDPRLEALQNQYNKDKAAIEDLYSKKE